MGVVAVRAAWLAAVGLGVASMLSLGCGGSSGNPTAPTPPPGGGPPPPRGPTGQTATLVAVGDTGLCGSPGVEQAAKLADAVTDGQVLLVGDLAYYQGTMQEFLKCFDPVWGTFRARWRPVPGNHEYDTPGAAGYFQYFGEAASHSGRSFYSFQAGDWLVVMLDSNIDVGPGSAQYAFVRSEVERHRDFCTLAVWHHPLYSSGPNGSIASMRDLWKLLYDHNAEIVVSGHDHLYERFGKQDGDGRSDARGLRQFVVGTGGANLYDFMRVTPNSQARIKSYGVLRLTLRPNGYDWAFIDSTGFTADAGSDSCH